MAGVAKLFGDHVLNKSNEKVDFKDEKYKGKVVGVYFSAHWCPPCRRFTPILIDFYKKHHEDKKFEIIFVSSDEDEESFDKYYKDMPWFKLDHKQEETKDELEKKFDVDGIPKLVLLDGDSGDVICASARDQIQNKDKEGKNFPWKNEKEEEKK